MRSCVLSVAIVVASWATGSTAKADDAPGTAVLNMNSSWRWQVTLRKPLLRKDGQLEPILQGRSEIGVDSALPPAGWAAADFDDQSWPRMQGPFFRTLRGHAYVPAVDGKGYLAYEAGGPCMALLCIRGKFAVTDPAKAGELTLSCSYRGGVVVYLNGKEIARGSLPDPDGRGPEALAEDYSNDVCLDPGGQLIGIGPSAAKNADRLAGRIRSLADVKVPADRLRRGVNVLAVEVHRSPYPDAILKCLAAHNVQIFDWMPMGLVGLELRATGAGVVPNVSRPAGVHAWAVDVQDRVADGDYPDPNEPAAAIRIEAARNGWFCGQAALAGDGELKAVRARASSLKLATGDATIPPADVAVLYGARTLAERGLPQWFDGLTSTPPEDVPAGGNGAAQAIYLRVHVPKDAAPGDYVGRLTVSAAGAQDMVVPIELHVADWAIPEPKDFRTFVSIYQSPTTLAMQYNVKPWSDEHWRLVDRSFALLGRAGDKLLNVPVAEHTQFGNDEGMIYWVRRPDGGYDYDFTVFDRFVAMAKRHCGTFDYVALQVWHSGGWETRKADQENTVTVLDPATGRHESLQVPVFGTEESKQFYRPLLAACREHLAKVGLQDAMCLGILSDGTAPPEVFKAFDAIWPGGGPSKWTRGLHSPDNHAAPYELVAGGARVVLHEYVYTPGPAEPDGPLPPIWDQRSMPRAYFCRYSGTDVAPLTFWTTLAEQGLFRRTRGIGRLCLDFWPVTKARGVWYAETVYNRYPFSSCAQRAPALMSMTWPGPDGAEPTIRFELLCQGIQSAEADIVLSDAVANHADELGGELAERCRLVLADRLRYLHVCDQSGYKPTFHCNHCGWADLERRLFGCAAEVGGKLGGTK